MSDPTPRTDLPILSARARVARAHRSGLTDDLIRLHKANLASAVLDNKIREQLREAELYPVHVAHLVGLILAESHVDGATVAVLEKVVRDAVEAGPNGADA